MNISEIKERYLKFPDKSDFVPVFEDDKFIFYFSSEEGLKKAKLLCIQTGISGEFIKTEKSFILEKLENYHEESIDDFDESGAISDDVSDILSSSYDDTPVIKLVNQIIINAVKENASDIHFENMESFFAVRLRIDGKLRTVKKFPKSLHDTVTARIKVISSLDVAENRKPQDGRIHLKIGNRNVDIRTSIMPSAFGEKTVLRILEKSKNLISLENIGFEEKDTAIIKKYLFKSNGIILVTGPTGSGKTTTLYASLLETDREEKNVVTIEDPIEYNINGITQVQVNPAVDLTFASAIRSFLRQDPDIMFIGEIRDDETAKAAIQASLTGHLVLSTLHTNDSSTAVSRLIEMDIEPFLISSALSLVISQRLVRKVCDNCAEEVKANETIKSYFNELGLNIDYYRKGKGCDKCFNTGYRGRTIIYELLEINDDIRNLIHKKASAHEILNLAVLKGMKKMSVYGGELIKKGVTTPEEVIALSGN